MNNFNDDSVEFQNDIDVAESIGIKKKLWNPKSFILISVFFSFLPAAILYSLNCGRLGNSKKRNLFMLASFFIFAIAISFGLFFEAVGIKALFYGLNIGLGIYMQKDQINAYNEHISNGGEKASLLIPMITCVVFAAFAIWGSIYSVNIPDKMLKVNGDEVYYTDNVKIDEVKKLGNYLEKVGLLADDGNSIAVKIDKKLDKYIFSAVINKEYINDKASLDYFKSLAQQLSTEVYSSKVEVDLCDDKFYPLKTITN